MMGQKQTNIPNLRIMETGIEYKVNEVTGNQGNYMPPHLSTKEAIVVVHYGRSTLVVNDKQISLLLAVL